MSCLTKDGFDWARGDADFHAMLPLFDGNQRNALDLAPVQTLVDVVRPIIEAHLGKARCVRGILFDKTARTNWKVAWHQDRSIAVRERVDRPGYGPWSTKAGITHVQPPSAVLENMLTARLHLDSTPASNGALRVIPGSHAQGILDDCAITEMTAREATTCAAEVGDVLLMRPLLLHASSAAQVPGHRRVVHLEFAPSDLLDRSLTWRWFC